MAHHGEVRAALDKLARLTDVVFEGMLREHRVRVQRNLAGPVEIEAFRLEEARRRAVAAATPVVAMSTGLTRFVEPPSAPPAPLFAVWKKVPNSWPPDYELVGTQRKVYVRGRKVVGKGARQWYLVEVDGAYLRDAQGDRQFTTLQDAKSEAVRHAGGSERGAGSSGTRRAELAARVVRFRDALQEAFAQGEITKTQHGRFLRAVPHPAQIEGPTQEPASHLDGLEGQVEAAEVAFSAALAKMPRSSARGASAPPAPPAPDFPFEPAKFRAGGVEPRHLPFEPAIEPDRPRPSKAPAQAPPGSFAAAVAAGSVHGASPAPRGDWASVREGQWVQWTPFEGVQKPVYRGRVHSIHPLEGGAHYWALLHDVMARSRAFDAAWQPVLIREFKDMPLVDSREGTLVPAAAPATSPAPAASTYPEGWAETAVGDFVVAQPLRPGLYTMRGLVVDVLAQGKTASVTLSPVELLEKDGSWRRLPPPGTRATSDKYALVQRQPAVIEGLLAAGWRNDQPYPAALTGVATAQYTRTEFQTYLAERMLAAGLGMKQPERVAAMARVLADAVLQGRWHDLLLPANKNFRGLFEEVTGVKLPKTEKGTVALFDGRQFPAMVRGIPVAPEPLFIERYPVRLGQLLRAPVVATANGGKAVALHPKNPPVPLDGSLDERDAKVVLWRTALAYPDRVPFDAVTGTNLELLRDLFQKGVTVTLLTMGAQAAFPSRTVLTFDAPASITPQGDLQIQVRIAGKRGVKVYALTPRTLGEVYVWLGDVPMRAPQLQAMFDTKLLRQYAASVSLAPVVHDALEEPEAPLLLDEWNRLREADRVQETLPRGPAPSMPVVMTGTTSRGKTTIVSKPTYEAALWGEVPPPAALAPSQPPDPVFDPARFRAGGFEEGRPRPPRAPAAPRPDFPFDKGKFGPGPREEGRPRPTKVDAAAPVGAILPVEPGAAKVAIEEGTWSPLQRDVFLAVRDGTENLILEAVAGSGKTTTLLASLRYIPKTKRVLIAAFNKTIQKELSAKIATKFKPGEMDHVTVTTLAAHGYAILKRYWKARMLTKKGRNGDVCEKLRDKVVFNAALNYEFIGGDEPMRVLEDLQSLIDLCESYLALTPDAILAVAEDYDLFVNDKPTAAQYGTGARKWRYRGKNRLFTSADLVTWVQRAQAERLREPKGPNYGIKALLGDYNLKYGKDVYNELTEDGAKGFISFADMAFVPAVMTDWVPEVLYDVIYVDETQDMDLAQLALVRRSLKPGGRVIVVGDGKQAIYRFRGAAPGSMERLKAELKARVLPLDISYRVTQCAARLAQRVVPTFRVPDGSDGRPPAPEGVCEILPASKMVNAWRAGDIVITRLNKPLVPMAMLAISKGITPWILGEGNSIQTTLRIIFSKILRAGGMRGDEPIGDFVKALNAWHTAERREKEAEVRRRVEAYNKKPGVTRKWNLQDALEKDPDLLETDLILNAFWNAGLTGLTQMKGLTMTAELLERLNRLAPTEKEIEAMSPDEYAELLASRLVLTSVHRIKGGEGPRTFVLVDTFKYGPDGWQKRKPANPKEQQEEMNLWYVAVTRSKYTLDPPGGGLMYLVSGIDSVLGNRREYKTEAQEGEEATKPNRMPNGPAPVKLPPLARWTRQRGFAGHGFLQWESTTRPWRFVIAPDGRGDFTATVYQRGAACATARPGAAPSARGRAVQRTADACVDFGEGYRSEAAAHAALQRWCDAHRVAKPNAKTPWPAPRYAWTAADARSPRAAQLYAEAGDGRTHCEFAHPFATHPVAQAAWREHVARQSKRTARA